MFALVFDGWSSHGTHFLTIFATWPDIQQASGYSQVMLSFAPLSDEEHLDAQSHKESMHGILQFYGKDYSNVACIIGDNCSTNRSLARMANLFFVGCASHRLNLGVKTILSSYSLLIDRIIGYMCFLRTIKGQAALRKHTNLSPLLCNATRWSSTREMVCRYFELLKIESVSNIVPDELQLSPAENRSGNALLKILDDLNTITKTFQDEDLHVYDSRLSRLCNFSIFRARSQIAEDQEFESAVVKIQRWQQGGEVFALTKKEIQSVSHLRSINIHSDNESDEPNTNTLASSELQAAFQAIKKRKMIKLQDVETFIDLRFIRPTSKIYERQFMDFHILKLPTCEFGNAAFESQLTFVGQISFSA